MTFQTLWQCLTEFSYVRTIEVPTQFACAVEVDAVQLVRQVFEPSRHAMQSCPCQLTGRLEREQQHLKHTTITPTVLYFNVYFTFYHWLHQHQVSGYEKKVSH